jgi:hypothetical protein
MMQKNIKGSSSNQFLSAKNSSSQKQILFNLKIRPDDQNPGR